MLDMNLTPQWIGVLQSAGHHVRHWSDIGKPDASDHEIARWASENQFCIVSQDLDFSSLLFNSRATSPSVILIRSLDARPETLTPMLLQTLEKISNELQKGALVSLDSSRARVSILPLGGITDAI
nr:DUF5615 family PIN-like protein [Oscillatoria laete-virens]